jgi:5-methylcytosine-specific restriction protein A
MKRTTGRRWMEIRRHMLELQPLCVMCSKNGILKFAHEVDHKIPLHKGGTDDYSNLQCLCREHHYKKTQEEQGKRYRSKIGKDGVPSDPDHPWNRAG